LKDCSGALAGVLRASLHTTEPASLNCARYFEQDAKTACLQDLAGLNDNKTDQFASEMLSLIQEDKTCLNRIFFFSDEATSRVCMIALGQESLWLWGGDSSGSQEWERPPLEADTRGLVKNSIPRRPSACVVKCIQTVKYR
jgi:hypothetical protein